MRVDQVEPLGVRVQFEVHALLPRLAHDLQHVDVIGLALADQPPGRMGEQVHLRVPERPQDPRGTFERPPVGPISQILAARPGMRSGSVTGPSPVDGLRRLFVFERVADYPFVLYVSIPTRAIAVAWLDRMRLAASLFVLLAIGGLWVHRHLTAQQAAHTAALALRQSRLALLHRIAVDVIDGVDADRVVRRALEELARRYPDLRASYATLDPRGAVHVLDCVAIQKAAGSRDLSLWFADGTNFPGSGSIRQRKQWFTELLRATHGALSGAMRMLVEYKPFEPAFYHTDIADWGMALLLARAAGPRAKVLVDTGHHYQAQNIEQIVAWLLDEDMLGGFHFNDRRYADDDLTLGSIDPYQVFRIFHEICFFTWERGAAPDIAYMVDQSHNLKNKIEEMIQTAMNAQELYLKAALVDHAALAAAQARADLIDAEEILKAAFFTDVRPLLREWREARGLAPEPLAAFRASGYLERIAAARAARNQGAVSSYA